MTNFEVTISFECDGSPGANGAKYVVKKFPEILEQFGIPFLIEEFQEKCKCKKVEYFPSVFVKFHIKHHIKSLETSHYLSMILQGYAGLHTLTPGVYSYSYLFHS